LLQSDLDSTGSWCFKNSLPLNLKKCHIVCYAKRSVTIPSTYHINNHPLSVLNEKVDLGVLFDDKFLFNEHLNLILPKPYAMFGFVKRNTLLFKDRYSWLSVYSAFAVLGLNMLPLFGIPREVSRSIGLRGCRKSFWSLHCNPWILLNRLRPMIVSVPCFTLIP